jgi:hypothetical protein
MISFALTLNLFRPRRTRVRHFRLWRLRFWTLAVALLASYGCSQKPALVKPASVGTSASSAPFGGSVSGGSAASVQDSPQYHRALKCFAHGDYRQALTLIDGLLTEPQYQQRSADLTFLQSQQAICRKALNPRARSKQASPRQASPRPEASAAVSPATASAALPPAAPADCGPRALLLACQTLGRPPWKSCAGRPARQPRAPRSRGCPKRRRRTALSLPASRWICPRWSSSRSQPSPGWTATTTSPCSPSRAIRPRSTIPINRRRRLLPHANSCSAPAASC